MERWRARWIRRSGVSPRPTRLARARFLAAATAAGATVTSYPHPLDGVNGEPLAIDVASIGDADATSVLLIVSGTHGVEGFTGSALQHHWWEHHRADRPDALRVVHLHAFNPHGFSWVRRVNEDNVDLNRNFIDWSQPPPANEDYGGIAQLLVPDAWDDDTQESTLLALLAYADEVGFDRLQEIVSGGQYTHPTGVFYGGAGPVWSHRWLREHALDLVGSAERVGIVDLHTGLGPWGHGELISHEGRGDAGYDRSVAWWGDVRSMTDGDSVSANLSGDWLGAVDGLLPGVEVTAVAWSTAPSTPSACCRPCAPTPYSTPRVIRSARAPTRCGPRCERRSPTTIRPGSTQLPIASTR